MEFKKNLMKILEDYITAKGWSSAINDDELYIRMELELDREEGNVRFALIPVDEGVVSYAVLPDTIPVYQYRDLSEFLHRANYGLLNGCFELDYEEGFIQFRTFCYCPNEESLTQDDMDVLFSVPLAILNRYISGIRLLLSGNVDSIAELIYQIENER